MVAVVLVPELVDLASTGEALAPVMSSTVMDTEDAVGRATDTVVAPPSELAASHTSSSVCLPRTTAVTRVKPSPALSETDPTLTSVSTLRTSTVTTSRSPVAVGVVVLAVSEAVVVVPAAAPNAWLSAGAPGTGVGRWRGCWGGSGCWGSARR